MQQSIVRIITDKTDILNLVLKDQFNESLLLTYFNQHSFNIICEDKDFKNLLDNEFKVYLDGVGMYLALKILGQNIKSRFNATEINEQIFSLLVRDFIPVILIGGRFEEKILNKCPMNLKMYFNGYENVENIENLIAQINESNVKTIILGMGSPKQEKLAFEISNKIPHLHLICVGNFLEFYFGTVRRAPLLLHNTGFEWVFRLVTEPKRLWKRYLIGIPIFIIRIIKLKIENSFTNN